MPSKVCVSSPYWQKVKQMKEEKELKGLLDQHVTVYWTVQDRQHNKTVPATGMAEAKYDIVLG